MASLRRVPPALDRILGFTVWLPLGMALGLTPCPAQTTGQYDAPSPAAPASFSVQPYGIVDAGLRHVDAVSAAGGVTQFASGLNTSRVGLRANETIDPDLRANFRLEGGFSPGTGAQSNSTSLFDRTAAVGLGWRAVDLKLGRMEGYGYELAATGVTDPLNMALNLPNYSSPAAAGSKAPVLGANPLQGVYSYTYGQLRFNNALRISATGPSWAVGLMYSLGGVAGNFDADSMRGAHLGWSAGPAQVQALFQQSLDLAGHRSTLDVLAGSWTLDAWKFQAGIHDLHIDAGFNSSGLGNGASSTGILGTSTTVSPILAGPTQDFRFEVADLGATWKVTPAVPLSLVAYKSRSEGAGPGNSVTLVALGKWYLSPRTALYLETDHANESGRLAIKTVSTSSLATAATVGINLHF